MNSWTRIPSAVALLALFALPAAAQDAGLQVAAASPGEDAELAALLSVLEEETAVATKSRMNSDYVPGIVSVFDGDELEALGIRNVGEALALVPGVQAALDGRGNPITIVRGLDFPFNSGNIQILLDSVPLSREDIGAHASVLLIPVEQVDRLEFIRGPGSVIYGDFAFMGMLNIVTRREGTRVWGGADSDETLFGGLRLGWKSASPGRPLALSFSLAAARSDDARVPQPRPAADEERLSAGLALDYAGLSLSAQLIDRELYSPLPAPAMPSVFEERSWNAALVYRRDLGRALQATARLYHWNNDIFTNNVFAGNVTKVGAEAHWTGLAHHDFLFVAEGSLGRIDRAFQNRPGGLVIGARERETVGLTVQDRIEVGGRLSFTLGARYDHYDDIGERLTPRLAMVWRGSERHIVKAQYAEGFRAPTFFERYRANGTTNDVDFEVNGTTELTYIYRRPGMVTRATLFRTELEDMIFGAGPPGVFGNVAFAQAQGVELEWNGELGDRLTAEANWSWVDTEDNRGVPRTVHENDVAARWLGNVALLWRPLAGTLVGVRWNIVGDRARYGFDGYDVLDLTVTKQNLFFPGFDLRGGVKNALEGDVVYYGSRPSMPPVGASFPGRTWWIQVGWRR